MNEEHELSVEGGPGPGMSCVAFEDRIVAVLGGRVGEPERAAFDAHAAACADCRRRLDVEARLQADLGGPPLLKPSRALQAALLAVPHRERSTRALVPLAALPAAMVLCAAGSLALWWLLPGLTDHRAGRTLPTASLAVAPATPSAPGSEGGLSPSLPLRERPGLAERVPTARPRIPAGAAARPALPAATRAAGPAAIAALPPGQVAVPALAGPTAGVPPTQAPASVPAASEGRRDRDSVRRATGEPPPEPSMPPAPSTEAPDPAATPLPTSAPPGGVPVGTPSTPPAPGPSMTPLPERPSPSPVHPSPSPSPAEPSATPPPAPALPSPSPTPSPSPSPSPSPGPSPTP